MHPGVQAAACVADCSDAVELDPGRVKAYFRRALAREQLGEHGDALRDAKRALEVQHGGTEYVGQYGYEYCVETPLLHFRSSSIER